MNRDMNRLYELWLNAEGSMIRNFDHFIWLLGFILYRQIIYRKGTLSLYPSWITCSVQLIMLHTHVHNEHVLCSLLAGPTNSVIKSITYLSYSNLIDCSFLRNQSFYCVVCCSTDPSFPSDSSLYNISTTRGTEVTVSLQGFTSGQMYHCKAAATSTNSTHCVGSLVGDAKVYFSFVASLPSLPFPTYGKSPICTSIQSVLCIALTNTNTYARISIPIKNSISKNTIWTINECRSIMLGCISQMLVVL